MCVCVCVCVCVYTSQREKCSVGKGERTRPVTTKHTARRGGKLRRILRACWLGTCISRAHVKRRKSLPAAIISLLFALSPCTCCEQHPDCDVEVEDAQHREAACFVQELPTLSGAQKHRHVRTTLPPLHREASFKW